MIYEGLGLPRVEFAAADVRDNDYDAYVPTYLTYFHLSQLPTYSPTYFRELFTLCFEYLRWYSLFFALSLARLFYISFSLPRSFPALTAGPSALALVYRRDK